MDEQLTLLLQDRLQPSETVKLVLDVLDPPTVDGASAVQLSQDPRAKKILAFVWHQDFQSSVETGCIMICQLKNHYASHLPGSLSLEHLFPIYGDFGISVAQPRRLSSSVDVSSPVIVSPQERPKTELTLTIKPANSPSEQLSIITNDTQGLSSLLAEVNRLERSHDDLDSAFAWIAPYLPHGGKIPLLSPIPPDLRILTKPLDTLLAPASAGVPGDEAADIDLIREDWLRHKVYQDVVAKCEERVTLRIRIGTFNVNGKFPSQDLSTWVAGRTTAPASRFRAPLKEISPLSADTASTTTDVTLGGQEQPVDFTRDTESEALGTVESHSTAADKTSSLSSLNSLSSALPQSPIDAEEEPTDPDILALGFQELDLSAGALLYSTEKTREDAWCVAVFAGLGEKAVLYEKLVSIQLVGMLLVVIVKKRLKHCFGEISTASIGAGIMGIMGNKGATAIRMSFTPDANLSRGPTSTPSPPQPSPAKRPTVLTFMNAHLAAFDEMYEKRNLDFHDLSKRVLFDSGIPAESDPGSQWAPTTVSLSVYETDVLFWIGDLNYRVNLPDTDIRSLLRSEPKQRNSKDILRMDQLSLAMHSQKAFGGFVEFPITHPPTYRFSSGVMTDSLGYDIKRKPAWTDRILHLRSPHLSLEQLTYTSHAEITMSDHKPVSADFEAQLPVIDSELYGKYVRGLWQNMFNLEQSEEVPKLKVIQSTIDFGKIPYKHRVERTIQLTNEGKIPCVYRFVPAILDAAIHPRWIAIEKMSGLVEPGATVDILLAAYVDDREAASLNRKNPRLEDTLILHTALGKDHFMSILGEYERTCFANSLDWLTRLPGPVRALKTPEDILPEENAENAPKEVMRLINWLMSHAAELDGAFTQEAEGSLTGVIREALDSGLEFPEPTPGNPRQLAFAVAQCLLEMLASLTEPLIPVSLHAQCSKVVSRDEAFELLNGLPSAAVNVWISVTAFLHFIGQQGSPTQVDELVAIFTPVMFGDKAIDGYPVSILGKRNFLRYFIQ